MFYVKDKVIKTIFVANDGYQSELRMGQQT